MLEEKMVPELFSPRGTQLQREPSELDLQFDAFTHETDALDYCDEQIVQTFCYSPTDRWCGLELYQREYRRATVCPWNRLAEWVFEDMNCLPRDFMSKILGYCEVRADIPVWTKLTDVNDSLLFILRGSVSLIEFIPTPQEDIRPEMQSFSFRQGKRLVKRYPPGHVIGKHSFFLRARGRALDSELDPRPVISSRMGQAEIWLLRRQQWDRLPADLRGSLTESLCLQFADVSLHSRLQEH